MGCHPEFASRITLILQPRVSPPYTTAPALVRSLLQPPIRTLERRLSAPATRVMRPKLRCTTRRRPAARPAHGPRPAGSAPAGGGPSGLEPHRPRTITVLVTLAPSSPFSA